MFLLGLSGCGYKKAPYYLEEAPSGDENVEFIIKQPSDNNESKNSENKSSINETN